MNTKGVPSFEGSQKVKISKHHSSLLLDASGAMDMHGVPYFSRGRMFLCIGSWEGDGDSM